MKKVKIKKFLTSLMYVFAGGLYVYFFGGIVMPNLNDSAHAVAMLNSEGGYAFHPVSFDIDDALFGQFNLMMTAKVLPPVSGDFVVSLVGPEELEYVVSSRYPPGVPLFNRRDRWYTFEDSIFKGVTTGSDMVIVLQIKSPAEVGVYQLSIADNDTGQSYFSMPITFSKGGVMPPNATCH